MPPNWTSISGSKVHLLSTVPQTQINSNVGSQPRQKAGRKGTLPLRYEDEVCGTHVAQRHRSVEVDSSCSITLCERGLTTGEIHKLFPAKALERPQTERTQGQEIPNQLLLLPSTLQHSSLPCPVNAWLYSSWLSDYVESSEVFPVSRNTHK